MLLHRLEALSRERRLLEQTIEEVFQITIDDGKRSAQLMTGIGHEVLADLLGLVAVRLITNDHAEMPGLILTKEAHGRRRHYQKALYGQAVPNEDQTEFLLIPLHSASSHAMEKGEYPLVCDE